MSMTIWCDGCRRQVQLDRWAVIFHAAPVFSRKGKRLGWIETRQHSVCRTVAHLPVAKPQTRHILSA